MNDIYTRLNEAADTLLSRSPSPHQLKRLERRFLHYGLPVPLDLTAELLVAGCFPNKRNHTQPIHF